MNDFLQKKQTYSDLKNALGQTDPIYALIRCVHSKG